MNLNAKQNNIKKKLNQFYVDLLVTKERKH